MIKLNGYPVVATTFPDNTSQVWKLDRSIFWKSLVDIEWIYSNEAEVMQFFQLLDLLEKNMVRMNVLIPYLPYARQDKVVDNDSTFALNTFLRLFNTFDYIEQLTVVDPHNVEAIKTECKFKAIYPIMMVYGCKFQTGSDIFCYPDRGARAKYSKIYEEAQYIYGEKVRDQATGQIMSYNLIGECKGKKVMIVDDICDGGATFTTLAKALIERGAREVSLFVTHGIFSKGTKVLFDSGIKRIFTKDGEVTERSEKLQF